MRLLALDASSRQGEAALVSWDAGRTSLVAEFSEELGNTHSSRLLPMVEALLAGAGWPKSSLDGYAAIRGPGSFTGIRVALGLVSGLAMAASRPCVGVGTLPAMAEAYGPAPVARVPLLDAGRGEVYGARFDAAGSPPAAECEAWVGDARLALAPGGPIVVFGSGASAYEARLREAGFTGEIGSAPRSLAAAAGRIALAWLAAGAVPPGDLAPLYIRPTDAELKFR